MKVQFDGDSIRKSPKLTLGIEPATFRLAASCHSVTGICISLNDHIVPIGSLYLWELGVVTETVVTSNITLSQGVQKRLFGAYCCLNHLRFFQILFKGRNHCVEESSKKSSVQFFKCLVGQWKLSQRQLLRQDIFATKKLLKYKRLIKLVAT